MARQWEAGVKGGGIGVSTPLIATVDISTSRWVAHIMGELAGGDQWQWQKWGETHVLPLLPWSGWHAHWEGMRDENLLLQLTWYPRNGLCRSPTTKRRIGPFGIEVPKIADPLASLGTCCPIYLTGILPDTALLLPQISFLPASVSVSHLSATLVLFDPCYFLCFSSSPVLSKLHEIQAFQRSHHMQH